MNDRESTSRHLELERECKESAESLLFDPDIQEMFPNGLGPEDAAVLERGIAEIALDNTLSTIAGAWRVAHRLDFSTIGAGARLTNEAAPLLRDSAKGLCTDVLILQDIIDNAALATATGSDGPGPADTVARVRDLETMLSAISKTMDTMDREPTMTYECSNPVSVTNATG